MPLDKRVRFDAARSGISDEQSQNRLEETDGSARLEESARDRVFRPAEPIPDRALRPAEPVSDRALRPADPIFSKVPYFEEPNSDRMTRENAGSKNSSGRQREILENFEPKLQTPEVIPIGSEAKEPESEFREMLADAVGEIIHQMGALQKKSGVEEMSRQISSFQEKIEGLDTERQLNALEKKLDTLEASLAEIGAKQTKNDRQLSQYIKENVNFQVQVRQGMQEELEEFRREKKGDQYNAILRELADIFSMYKPLLLENSVPEKLPKNISAMFEQLEDLMNDYGAETFQSSLETERTPRMSKVIRRVPTRDRTKHNLIAKSRRPGVRKGKLILSEEYVDLYVYDETLDVPQLEPEPEKEPESDEITKQTETEYVSSNEA